MEDDPADYKQLFDDAPCGYLVVDADGVIVLANTWMTSLLGYPAGGLNGRRLREVFSMAGRILFETNLAPLLRLQQTVSEVTLDLKRSNGSSVPVIMAASSVSDAAGRSTGIRIAFVQAQERRLYERELATARETAEQGLRQQQAAGELREQFIAVLGHDLRNPLASISAAARMLAKETLSDRGRHVIGLMQGSALRMSGLIDNVLDFARARLGNGIGLDLQCEVVLEPLLDQVVHELQASHPEHKILTAYDISKAVKCDATKIGQLASNLLGNALSHGDKETPVWLRAETSPTGGFRIRVSNGGSPIPMEALPKLFEPFVRGHGKGGSQGLGLGLFIAHQIATAHGGTLTATSSNTLTEFMFELPGPDTNDSSLVS